MGLTGPEFYDDPVVFAEYSRRRVRDGNPNDTLEKPVLLDLIGDAAGLRILDLGCGDARIGKDLLERGAQSYLGVEGSQNMVRLASSLLAGLAGSVAHASIQAWDYPNAAFDLAISRLALHYLDDEEWSTVLHRVRCSLRPGGRLVFSVEHPVITSSDKGWQTGLRQDWVVDDYFSTGRRESEWMGGQVVKYHRTVEDYFGSVQRAGFEVESLREARPRPEHFTDPELYARRMRIPLFLFIAARKPGSVDGND